MCRASIWGRTLASQKTACGTCQPQVSLSSHSKSCSLSPLCNFPLPAATVSIPLTLLPKDSSGRASQEGSICGTGKGVGTSYTAMTELYREERACIGLLHAPSYVYNSTLGSTDPFPVAVEVGRPQQRGWKAASIPAKAALPSLPASSPQSPWQQAYP